MKKLFIILLSALSLTTIAQNKSVAILNPLDRGGSVSSAYKMIVRSSFETVASVTQGYEAFDRTALDAIMSEHNFQRSGAVNDAEIRQIGQMAGVDYVLVTEVSAEDGYLVVQAKILNVVTAKYDRAVDDLMEMTPPKVKEGCTSLAQKLFKINISTGNLKGEIVYYGKKYVGEYKDGIPNGKGKLYYSTDDNWNRLTYEGNFVNGIRQGKGTLTWKDGGKYDGEWVNDNMFNGTYYYPNGNKYIGYFLDSKRHGKGTFYWTNGDKYVGQWANNLRNGKGIIYYSDGTRFEGIFKDDKRNGYGVYYYNSKGWEHRGNWTMGVKNGQFKEYTSNGYWDEGMYVDGKKEGKWKCYLDYRHDSTVHYKNGKQVFLHRCPSIF